MGLAVFNSIPQGLSVNPSIFQTAMVDILEEMLYKSVTVYLDDICVFDETFDKTLENTIEVLKRLDVRKIKIKTTKCKLFAEEIELLEHYLKFNEILHSDKRNQIAQDNKASEIISWPNRLPPQNDQKLCQDCYTTYRYNTRN